MWQLPTLATVSASSTLRDVPTTLLVLDFGRLRMASDSSRDEGNDDYNDSCAHWLCDGCVAHVTLDLVVDSAHVDRVAVTMSAMQLFLVDLDASPVDDLKRSMREHHVTTVCAHCCV
jgi:hypothetical protein